MELGGLEPRPPGCDPPALHRWRGRKRRVSRHVTRRPAGAFGANSSDSRRLPRSQALLAMSAWTSEVVARSRVVVSGRIEPRRADGRARRTARSEPAHRWRTVEEACRLGLFDEQASRVV